MITVQDQIVVAPGDLGRLESMFESQYLPGAEARGLRFREKQVSPPVITAAGPLTLWVRWDVPDAGAWWAMRAQSGCAEVYAFWQAVDAFCLSRERRYLVDPAVDSLPAVSAESESRFELRAYRETAQLALKDADADLEAALAPLLKELPGLDKSNLARNLAPEYAAGHYTWDLLFADAKTAAKTRQSSCWTDGVLPLLERHCDAVHAQALDHLDGGIRDRAMAGGVKRTAFFRLLPGVGPDTAARFERDLLEMPRHIHEIRNWRLSRARPAAWIRAATAPWTYVWEQEFADLEGLTGPYMTHPHHWAHIDRWFDPESGGQAVDVEISHAFNYFESGILDLELMEVAG